MPSILPEIYILTICMFCMLEVPNFYSFATKKYIFFNKERDLNIKSKA